MKCVRYIHCCKHIRCSHCCKNRRWCCPCTYLYALFNVPYFKLIFLLTLVAMVSITHVCKNIPFSPLYRKYNQENDVLHVVQELNEGRLNRSMQYFQKLDNKTSQDFYRQRSSTVSDIVVCIVTISRTRNTAKTGYLIQTAAAIDQILKQDQFFPKTSLFVCNVDKQPNLHSDAVMLQNYMPYVQKNGSNFWNKNFPVVNVSLHHKIVSRGQEIADYTFCLNATYSFGSPYVLVLEDDVVPYKNIFEVLHYMLKQHNLRKPYQNIDGMTSRRQFSFLKLYYPERWQGYANEADRVIELISVGALGGGVIFSLFSLLIHIRRSNVSYKATFFYYCIFSAITIFVAAMYGRQNVIDLRRISPVLFKFGSTPACCTPAMFYSSHIIPNLVTYLLQHSDINKDLAMYDFIVKSSIPGYLIEPNLFRHIGMYTSLQDSYKTPYDFVFMDT